MAFGYMGRRPPPTPGPSAALQADNKVRLKGNLPSIHRSLRRLLPAPDPFDLFFKIWSLADAAFPRLYG